MSKDKLENNDIWEDESQRKFVICNVVYYSVENTLVITRLQVMRFHFPFYYLVDMKPEDFENCKYIGKSEANLEEMFNVKK